MKDAKVKLGRLLLDAGLVDERGLKAALCYQKNQRCLLGASLVRLGFLSEEKLLDFLERNLALERVDLDGFSPPSEVLACVSMERALAFTVFPVERLQPPRGPVLRMAMADPCNLTVIDALEFMTGLSIQPVLASESAIRCAIQKHYASRGGVEYRTVSGERVENDCKTVVSVDKYNKLVELLQGKGILSAEDVQELDRIL